MQNKWFAMKMIKTNFVAESTNLYLFVDNKARRMTPHTFLEVWWINFEVFYFFLFFVYWKWIQPRLDEWHVIWDKYLYLWDMICKLMFDLLLLFFRLMVLFQNGKNISKFRNKCIHLVITKNMANKTIINVKLKKQKT